jgi:hypothetical protein
MLLTTGATRACDVPVCQFAREHWAPDAYRVAVLYHGPLRPDERAAADALAAGPANVTVELIDADAPADDAQRGVCRSCQGRELPWVVVRGPAALGQNTIWEGRLSDAAAAADSPRRRDIARSLLGGAPAVWVLLESGKRERDEAAAEALRAQTETMRANLGPPPSDGGPDDGTPRPEAASPSPCAVVRVARDDPAERPLVEMLLASEPDLRGRDGPMAFPVFGRGRVLYALVGPGVNADNLRRAAAFLTGECSCTVKRQTPGVDLLLAADWGPAPTAPEGTSPALPSPGEVASTPAAVPPPAVGRPETPRADAAVERWPAGWLTWATAAAAAATAVTGWLTLRPRKRLPSP